jgi:outer membrane protein OmpA-like peptidoglycan-associated protein
MKTVSMTAAAVIACLVAGCASKPPPELRSARTAYNTAAQSPGAHLVAADLYEAKKSLGVAEKAFEDNGDEAETRDLAYVAERRAISVHSRGNAALSAEQKKMALADLEQFRNQQAAQQREQLGEARNQLVRSQQQIESERLARAAAEQRTADALSRIQGLTTKLESRGLVLTLSGSVLFAFGKSDLLPTAQRRLDDVITALKDDQRNITVVGHTDSVGDEDKNMALSQRRADAVRQYIVTHGIPESRVTAQGMGETQPVADNRNATSRANNRRVEIILQGTPSTQGSGSMPGSGGQQGGGGQQPTPPQQQPMDIKQ